MTFDVICLRPKDDFLNIGVTPPEALSVRYLAPTDSDLKNHLATARALLIPAVGPKLPAALFEGGSVKLSDEAGKRSRMVGSGWRRQAT